MTCKQWIVNIIEICLPSISIVNILHTYQNKGSQSEMDCEMDYKIRRNLVDCSWSTNTPSPHLFFCLHKSYEILIELNFFNRYSIFLVNIPFSSS